MGLHMKQRQTLMHTGRQHYDGVLENSLILSIPRPAEVCALEQGVHLCLTFDVGAIMFNDPLDVDQCSRLILQLSNTIWPFMCAHGR